MSRSSLFALSSVVVVLATAAPSLLSPDASAAEASVGVTPPYVRNSVLLPGSHYRQNITAIESGNTAVDRWVHPVLDAPTVAGWISYDPPPPFRIPAGETLARFDVVVDVPLDAAVGANTGGLRLRFNTSPDYASGGGVYLNVSLTVVDEPIVDLSVRRTYAIPDTVGRTPIEVCFDLQNNGNTAGGYSRVGVDLAVYGGPNKGDLVASYETEDVPQVAPFSREKVCAYVPNDHSPTAAWTYYLANRKFYLGDTLAFASQTSVKFLPNPNALPVPRAGDDQVVVASADGVASVTLDGSASTDANSTPGTNDAIVDYAWTLDGQLVADAPVVTLDLVAGVYVFTLRVTDDAGESRADSVTVTVLPPNAPPVAVAGEDVEVTEGYDGFATVVVDGSASSDADSSPGTNDDIVSFAWLLDGEPVAAAAVASLDLPPGAYVLTLVVVDAAGASDAADVVVIVNALPPNTPPVAAAGDDQTHIILEGEVATVSLDGSASSDADSTAGTNDDIVSFAWTLGGVVVATGSEATLVLEPGEHVVTLTVVDRRGGVGTDDVRISVVAIPPNEPPVAVAVVEETVVADEDCAAVVVLDGAGSSDPDSTPGTHDDIARFAWYVDGELAAEGEMAQVVLGPGTWDVTLVVTDHEGEEAEDAAVVTVVDETGPAVSASVAVDILWPADGEMVDVGLTWSAVDACDGASAVTVTVTSDESGVAEPAAAQAPGAGKGNGKGKGKGPPFAVPGPPAAPGPPSWVPGQAGGDAQVDAEIGEDGTLSLRATRAGNGDGRVYRVTVAAVDAAGNASEAALVVSVPHRANRAAVDSGQGEPIAVRAFAPPADEPPADEPPADEPPADEPPTDEPPADEPPADEPPADEPPTDEPPTDEPPADEPPTDEPPADEPPADEPPADEPPADEPPADEPPADEPPADEPLDVWTRHTEPRVVALDPDTLVGTVAWEPLAGAASYRVSRYDGANYARVFSHQSMERTFTSAVGQAWRVEAVDAAGEVLDFVNVRVWIAGFPVPTSFATGTFFDDFEDGVLGPHYVNPKPYQVSEANGVLRLTQTHTDDRSNFYLAYDTEGRRYLRITARVFQYRSGTQPWSGGTRLYSVDNAWKYVTFYSPWETYMKYYGADLRASDYRADVPDETTLIFRDLDQVIRFGYWYDYELIVDTETGLVSGAMDGQTYADQFPIATNFLASGKVILHIQPYGWFTGHYMMFDDLLVESWD